MEMELRILMLEDMEEDAGLIDRALQKEKIAFNRLRVDDRNEFTEALVTFKPNVILSDHSLPHFNSIEALKIFQLKKLDIPFILVTGEVSEEFAVNCLKRGADDYVLKSNLSRLPLAIQHALRQHQDENTRKENEKNLFLQNEELIKINSELDSFVYSISHTLRSPLASILGLVNEAQLEAEKSNETVDHYFKLIEKSIHKLDHTLKDILDYSQNARTEVDTSEINLKELIEESFEQLKYLKGQHEIEKYIEVQDNPPFYSNAYDLRCILSNLISNAIKYRDEAKEKCFIQILVSITGFAASIQVNDNGIGIHPDHLPNVFNMFYRGTVSSDGAGLGLYIVKEMIEKLGGTIAISSRPYEETQITLTIPNLSPAS
ncbi:MAG: ATP-binding protein [Bacteroidota bacterium]